MRDQCLAKLRKYSLWNWYLSPLATETTDHKFSGLRQQKFLILFWSCHVACEILVPQPGMKLMSAALEAWSPNHWSFREIQRQQKCLTVLEFRSSKSIPPGYSQKSTVPVLLGGSRESPLLAFCRSSQWSMFLGCCSVAQSCLILCDPLDCNTPGFPALHYLLEFAQAHVH